MKHSINVTAFKLKVDKHIDLWYKNKKVAKAGDVQEPVPHIIVDGQKTLLYVSQKRFLAIFVFIWLF